MKLKWITVLLILFSILFSFNVALCATEESDKSPKAVIAEPNFEFETVPEGTKVTHNYIIKNEGTATLEITKVKPG